MATATAPQRRPGTSRNTRSCGKASTATTARCAAKTSAASETVVTTNLRRQGIRITKIKRQTFRGGERGQREGHHVLHAPARDDAEGRRAAAAGVRDRRARPQQRPLLAADDGHQEPGRGGLEPVAGVPRASGAFDDALLQPGARRRDGRHARRDPRPARDLQGKDPRDQEQDQVGAVLPDLGGRRRDRRHLGDHGLGDPGVQAGVRELRRRPAGADADRDGDLRFRRRLVVADVPRHRSARSSAFAVPVQALGGVPLRLRPHARSSSRSIGAILEKATIARWTRTLATMFAAGVPLVESLDAVAGASGNAVYAPARKRSRPRSAPARASPTR